MFTPQIFIDFLLWVTFSSRNQVHKIPVSYSKLQDTVKDKEAVKDREAWHATVYGHEVSDMTERMNKNTTVHRKLMFKWKREKLG